MFDALHFLHAPWRNVGNGSYENVSSPYQPFNGDKGEIKDCPICLTSDRINELIHHGGDGIHHPIHYECARQYVNSCNDGIIQCPTCRTEVDPTSIETLASEMERRMAENNIKFPLIGLRTNLQEMLGSSPDYQKQIEWVNKIYMGEVFPVSDKDSFGASLVVAFLLFLHRNDETSDALSSLFPSLSLPFDYLNISERLQLGIQRIKSDPTNSGLLEGLLSNSIFMQEFIDLFREEQNHLLKRAERHKSYSEDYLTQIEREFPSKGMQKRDKAALFSLHQDINIHVLTFNKKNSYAPTVEIYGDKSQRADMALLNIDGRIYPIAVMKETLLPTGYAAQIATHSSSLSRLYGRLQQIFQNPFVKRITKIVVTIVVLLAGSFVLDSLNRYLRQFSGRAVVRIS